MFVFFQKEEHVSQKPHSEGNNQETDISVFS